MLRKMIKNDIIILSTVGVFLQPQKHIEDYS